MPTVPVGAPTITIPTRLAFAPGKRRGGQTPRGETRFDFAGGQHPDADPSLGEVVGRGAHVGGESGEEGGTRTRDRRLRRLLL